MNRRLPIKGGRAFRFEYAPRISNADTPTDSPLAIPLATERYTLRPLITENKRYDAFTPLVSLKGTKNRLSFGYPRALRYTGLSDDGNAMLFTPEGDLEQPPKEGSLQERYLHSLTFLEVQNLLTGKLADPGVAPERIFVSTFNTEPFSADTAHFLKDLDLEEGVKALHALFGQMTAVTLLAPDVPGSPGKGGLHIDTENVDTLFLPDRYPAHDGHIPLAERIYKSQVARNPDKYWWMDTVTLKKITKIVNDVTIDYSILLGLGGSEHLKGSHTNALPFTALSAITGETPTTVRTITGGLLQGQEVISPSQYGVRPWDRGVSVIENPQTREMLHFIRPGGDRDSFSPSFLSWFLPKKLRSVHGGIRGEHRFCVSCNYCESVCPLGLDPSFLWKLTKEDLKEEAAEHGLLRCSGCGLCSYVCPSKLDLAHIISTKKAEWLNEIREDEA